MFCICFFSAFFANHHRFQVLLLCSMPNFKGGMGTQNAYSDILRVVTDHNIFNFFIKRHNVPHTIFYSSCFEEIKFELKCLLLLLHAKPEHFYQSLHHYLFTFGVSELSCLRILRAFSRSLLSLFEDLLIREASRLPQNHKKRQSPKSLRERMFYLSPQQHLEKQSQQCYLS